MKRFYYSVLWPRRQSITTIGGLQQRFCAVLDSVGVGVPSVRTCGPQMVPYTGPIATHSGSFEVNLIGSKMMEKQIVLHGNNMTAM